MSARELADRLPTGSSGVSEAPSPPETSILAPLEPIFRPPDEIPAEEHQAIEQRGGAIAAIRRTGLATTEETVAELERRLAKELYRFQLDLAAGCKIAGKPCDCCEKHPDLGLEAICEELIPMEPTNPIYQEIPKWYQGNAHKLTAEASASGKYDGEYPMMAAEMRNFRKRLLGTESLTAMAAPKQERILAGEKAESAKSTASARPIGGSNRSHNPRNADDRAPYDLFFDTRESIDKGRYIGGMDGNLSAAFEQARWRALNGST